MHLKVMQQMSRLPRSIGEFSSLTTFESDYIKNSRGLLSIPSGSASPPGYIESTQSSGNTSSSDATVFSNLSKNVPTPFNGNFTSSNTDDGQINPLAGMGLTDEQYSMILQNIVNGDALMDDGNTVSSLIEKRPLEEPGADERNGKRSRFELIE